MTGNKKILSLQTLAQKLESKRRDHKKIVHCHGVFDLLHIGHIRHFEQARRSGDVLVVTITPDRYVNKGPGRPVFPERLRAEAVAALGCVDYVAINEWPLAVEAIKLLRPHFYAKGPDYKDPVRDVTGGIVLEKEAIESVGGKLICTDDITFSSSHLINRQFSLLPEEAIAFITNFSKKYGADQIWPYLVHAQSLKILVLGEAIIDEYEYCDSIGKSGKEPILAVRYCFKEKFAGGVLAVANNVAQFCDHVALLTFLGSYDSQEDFINMKLNPKVKRMFLTMTNAPTIVKRRMVERYPFQKLFEVYVMRDDQGDQKQTKALCDKLEETLADYDVVIVTDYGHGMIESDAAEILCQQARFLAVNTQVNAANRGFNTISKYRRADYVCVSENELRLDARSQKGDLQDIVRALSEKLACEHILVTRGRQGCLCYDAKEGFFRVPAFTTRFEDRIGAGDTVFAITAFCVAQDAPMEIVGLIGNVVGAQAVVTVGHRKPIDHVALIKYIETLLK